tara:strand:- start:396 stop:509 length:114 start_codon:yes stop_codon:yes gene_type:complete
MTDLDTIIEEDLITSDKNTDETLAYILGKISEEIIEE